MDIYYPSPSPISKLSGLLEVEPGANLEHPQLVALFYAPRSHNWLAYPFQWYIMICIYVYVYIYMIWRFPKMGVPQIILLDWDFQWNESPSARFWGTPIDGNTHGAPLDLAPLVPARWNAWSPKSEGWNVGLIYGGYMAVSTNGGSHF